MTTRTVTRDAAARRRLADIDTDRALGIDPDRIAADQHTTRTALEKFCHRQGRHDLAAFFQTTRTPRKAGSCVDCDTPIAHDATRCVPCRWARERTAA